MLTILVESYSSTLYFGSLSHISFITQFYIWSFILTGWTVVWDPLSSSSKKKLNTYLKMMAQFVFQLLDWMLITTDDNFTIGVFALQCSCRSHDSEWILDFAFLLLWYLLLSSFEPQWNCTSSLEGPLQGQFEMTCRMARSFRALLRCAGPLNSLHEDLQELLAWKMAVWNISTYESNVLCQAASWHAYCSKNSTE